MAKTGTYIDELETELKRADSSTHAYRLLAQEIDRLAKGEDEKKERRPVQMIDLHHERPHKISLKVRVPVKEYPRYNFVGKLLGPKGQILKALQDQTGCKMAVMGKGSVREKEKEDELRKEGGKYAHLNEDLHVLIECYTEYADGYSRLAFALAELKKYVIPDLTEGMYGDGDMGMNGGSSYRGRGGYRSGPPERGGRGSYRGRGNGPWSRSGPPPRGGTRGAPSSRSRGSSSRGSRAAPPSYDSYGYGSGYDSAYEDSYGPSYSGQDSSYYDYGSGSGAAAGYDSYSGSGGYGDYSESWSSGGKTAPPSSRGASRASARSHPYARSSSGDY